MPEPAVSEPDHWHDLQPLLDQELSRLPDKYRVAIVLCDLDGKTRKEAARQLGCPEGTLAARLARGRVMLAKRLTRQGVALSGGALAALLSQNAASACVPTALVSSTIKAATLFAAGPAATAGVTSTQIAALTEGVLKAMLLSTLKNVTAVLVVLAVLAMGVAGFLCPTPAAELQQPKPEPSANQNGDKAKAALKPIVVKDGGQLIHVAWGADGKTVATIGYTADVVEDKKTGMKLMLTSHTIKLWDGTGKLERSLGEEKDTIVQSPAFSADKQTAALIVGRPGWDREKGGPPAEPQPSEVRVLDAKTWELKHKFTHQHASDDVGMTVTAIALAPDGRRLALGGGPRLSSAVAPIPQPGEEYPGCLRLWDVEKQKLIERKPKKGELAVKMAQCLAFSPDGKLIVAGEKDGKIRLFDGATGEPKTVLDEHKGWVMRVGFSPDGRTLASLSVDVRVGEDFVESDNTVKLWDVETRKPRATLKRNKLMAFAFSPDGKLLATTGLFEKEKGKWQPEIILWDAKTGEMKESLPTNLSVPAFSLAFSPDSKTLAVAGGLLGEIKDGGKASGEISIVPLGR